MGHGVHHVVVAGDKVGVVREMGQAGKVYTGGIRPQEEIYKLRKVSFRLTHNGS